MQRNFVLVNYLFKSKGSVANCITDTGNTSEQFLHHNSRAVARFLCLGGGGAVPDPKKFSEPRSGEENCLAF